MSKKKKIKKIEKELLGYADELKELAALQQSLLNEKALLEHKEGVNSNSKKLLN